MATDRPAQGIQVRTHDSLEEFDQAEWDSLLAGNAFYGSHAWLRVVRRHDSFSTRYVAARDVDGGLLGAVPLCSAKDPPRERQFDPSVIFKAVHGGFYPAAVVGLRAGYSTDFPFDPRMPRRNAEPVMSALMDACLAELRQEGGRSLSWLYVSPDVLRRISRSLPETACTVLAGADAVLAIRWDRFDDYLAGFGSDRRRKIRGDLAAFHRSGCEISFGRLTEYHAQVAPLLATLQRRYGAIDSVPLIQDRLAEQAAVLGDEAICLLCRKGSRIVGFSLFYKWRDELYARVVGFDYERLPEDSRAYFSLVFYEPIKYAIENGIKTIRYGLEPGNAKVGRGATLESRWAVTLGPGDVVAARECRRRNVAALRMVLERYRSFPEAIPSRSWSSGTWREMGVLPRDGEVQDSGAEVSPPDDYLAFFRA